MSTLSKTDIKFCDLITSFAISGQTANLEDGLNHPRIKNLMKVVRIGNLTLAHYALAKQDIRMLNVCIKADVGLDEKDGNGDTPIHYAAAWGNEEAIKTLLEQGVNLHARNHKLQEAWQVAKDLNNLKALFLLERAMHVKPDPIRPGPPV